ncbi:hypothetical protein VNO77_07721 [Canavalia gladiata]|uniref:Uncharacterized protein n=1 Tax=Canavalia gladiata TaxID=3824 RepID=A0AAN9M8M1_CANGL
MERGRRSLVSLELGLSNFDPLLRFFFVRPSSSLRKKNNLIWPKLLQIFQLNPIEAIADLDAIRRNKAKTSTMLHEFLSRRHDFVKCA